MNFSSILHIASSYRNSNGNNYPMVILLPVRTAFLKFFTFLLVIGFSSITINAQTETDPVATGFKKTLHDRSAKIINTLEISDSAKYNKVVDVLTDQYFDLNKIHDKTKESIAAIKSLQLSDEEKSARIKKEEEEKSAKLRKLHVGFISKLQKDLTGLQIEKVKDGMTYRVMPVTYTAYQDMILALTAEQKEKIYNWLKEARELAMDEGSSDDKHKVFGKYKGRINNYLSGEGYNMKTEEKGWQERIKAREAAKKDQAGK